MVWRMHGNGCNPDFADGRNGRSSLVAGMSPATHATVDHVVNGDDHDESITVCEAAATHATDRPIADYDRMAT